MNIRKIKVYAARSILVGAIVIMWAFAIVSMFQAMGWRWSSGFIAGGCAFIWLVMTASESLDQPPMAM